MSQWTTLQLPQQDLSLFIYLLLLFVLFVFGFSFEFGFDLEGRLQGKRIDRFEDMGREV